MNYEKIKVEKNYDSIYSFLKENEYSENYIKNLRKVWGYLKINGKEVNMRAPLLCDDILEICNNPNQKTNIQHCDIPLNIVFEDDDYLVVNKPSGICTIPTRAHYSHNLAGAICSYMEKKDKNFVLRIVNRLDKDTAGLVLIAKNSVALKKLTKTEKTYFAICEGVISEPITINKNIETKEENGIIKIKREVSQNGKPAITQVTPIKNFNNFTLLKITLTHGRTHQIRVHLSSINHPLLGDEIYGTPSPLIPHTALICKELTFFHPIANSQIFLQIPFSTDLINILEL